jgi:hypothetical protein
LARDAGVRHLGVGPKAIALTFGPGAAAAAFKRLGPKVSQGATLKADRIVIPALAGAAATAGVERLLGRLA